MPISRTLRGKTAVLLCAVRAPRRRAARYLRVMCYSTYTGFVTDLAAIAGLTRPGDSIRERRIELGWTQAELAEHSGVAQADISRIENGRLDALPEIASQYHALVNSRSGVSDALIESAFPVDGAQLAPAQGAHTP